MMKRIRKNTQMRDGSFKSKGPPSMSVDNRERPLEQILETEDLNDDHELKVSSSLVNDSIGALERHSEIINARKNPKITVSGVRMSFEKDDESQVLNTL